MKPNALRQMAAWPLPMVIACVVLLASCQENSGPSLVASPVAKPAADGAKPPPPPPADPAIAFVDRDYTELQVMNADGSNQTTVFEASRLDHPSWSPDGQTIAFTQGDNGLWLIDVEVVSGVPTGTNARVLLNRANIYDVACSPLGDRIAFADVVPKTIESIPVGGGTPEVWYTSESGATPRFPTWSRDASQIAFVEGDSGPLRMLDVATGQANTILGAEWGQQLGESASPRFIDWARTQDALVFDAGPGGRTGYKAVYMMQLPAGTPTFVVGGMKRSQARMPTWSPDDREIIFAKSYGDLYKVDLATAGTTKLRVSGKHADWRRF